MVWSSRDEKDQDFGDENDSLTYGALRTLQAHWQGTLLVVWMHTLPDGSFQGANDPT